MICTSTIHIITTCTVRIIHTNPDLSTGDAQFIFDVRDLLYWGSLRRGM